MAYIETYFPGKNCSSLLPRIPSQEPGGAACFINGNLYSGYVYGNLLLNSYNFSIQSWKSLPSSLGAILDGDPYTCIGNRIYMYNDNQPEYFDTFDIAWHYMSKPKSTAGTNSAMCEANGTLYVFGGFNGATIQVYDITNDEWSVLDAKLSYNTDMSCSKIPGTGDIMVLSSGLPSYIGLFHTGSISWLSPMAATSLQFGKLLAYGSKMYVFNGYGDTFAYCPNTSSLWQRVTDHQPLMVPRIVSLVALVPKSLLNLPAACTPSNYQCS